MIKSELVQRVSASSPHLFDHEAVAIVKSILDEITGALERGHRVELRGFGAFSVKTRRARSGRNPRTGASVPVTEKHVPYFKAGKDMRDRLNRGPKTSAEHRDE